MRLPLLLCLALLVPTLVGCVTSDEPGATTAADAAKAAAMNLSAPKVDAAKTLAALKTFSEAYPYRQSGTATHNGARDNLEAGFKAAGLETMRQTFASGVGAAPVPYDGQNILGIKWGTDRNHWVVVGAHYDITEGAVYGTYDDGSGTMIVQHLARAFANVTTARTIVFCNFDGEEEGLRGSTHMFKSVVDGSWKYANGTVVGDEDFDMAGINYPAAPPLVADVRSPEMKAVIDAAREAAKMPNGTVAYRGISSGSSDNGPFKAGQIPSVLFISDFDDVRLTTPAGAVPLPGNYPFWHRYDTYDGMVQLAGGADNLVKGFQNAEDIGSALLSFMATSAPLTFE